MKKIYLIVAMLISFGTSFSQEFFESFEGTFPPADWINLNYQGTPSDDWRQQGTVSISGNLVEAKEGSFYAASLSLLSGVGSFPDNWLISPKIGVTSSSVLSFSLLGATTKGNSVSYPAGDYIAVYLSKTGTNPADFTDSLYSKRLDPALEWFDVVVDLSAYDGENIHIAFRHYYSNDERFAALDAVRVTNTAAPSFDDPIANDDFAVTNQDTPVTIGVLVNDVADPNLTLDTLTVTVTTNATNGTTTVNEDGTITYTPNAGYFGTDSFVYQVCDNGDPSMCDQATVSITVVQTFNAPIVNNDVATTDQDTPVNINVLANDVADPNLMLDPSTVTVTTNATNGTTTVDADGTITYTPNAGFFGTDVFTYQVCDNGTPSACDNATVTVTVIEVGTTVAPVANDDNAETDKNIAVVINVLANDLADPSLMLVLSSVTVTSNPINGTTTVNADGTITYTPNAGYFGTDSLVYQVCDNGNPSQCDNATVTITVNEIEDTTNNLISLNKIISIYPNPTKEFVIINDNINIKNIDIYDITGNRISTEGIGHLINMKDYPTGLYYLYLYSHLNDRYIIKIIKE